MFSLSFHWWRTVFFLIPAIGVYTVGLGACSLGSSLFSGQGKFGHWCARTWSWFILATTGVKVNVTGCEQLQKRKTYVFVSNHQSIYDIPIIFWSIPHQLRIIAKASLAKFPVLGWHLRRTGHVLVDRRKPGQVTFKKISSILQEGLSLIVFPEGTRSIDGHIAGFKKAVFVLAIEAGLSIVPVSVSGSHRVMKPGRLTTCPGVVSLTVHAPVETSLLTRNDALDLADRVKRTIASAVYHEI